MNISFLTVGRSSVLTEDGGEGVRGREETVY